MIVNSLLSIAETILASNLDFVGILLCYLVILLLGICGKIYQEANGRSIRPTIELL